MMVILKKEVHNLGDAGQIVKVRDGFGRNYLIPRGFAIPALETNVRVLEHQQRVADAIRRKELAGAQELAARIGQTSLSFRREAGEDDRLFGSVTNRDIGEALAGEGIVVDRRQILLDDPIRHIGQVEVTVRLHKDISARMKVVVMKAPAGSGR